MFGCYRHAPKPLQAMEVELEEEAHLQGWAGGLAAPPRLHGPIVQAALAPRLRLVPRLRECAESAMQPVEVSAVVEAQAQAQAPSAASRAVGSAGTACGVEHRRISAIRHGQRRRPRRSLPAGPLTSRGSALGPGAWACSALLRPATPCYMYALLRPVRPPQQPARVQATRAAPVRTPGGSRMWTCGTAWVHAAPGSSVD